MNRNLIIGGNSEILNYAANLIQRLHYLLDASTLDTTIDPKSEEFITMLRTRLLAEVPQYTDSIVIENVPVQLLKALLVYFYDKTYTIHSASWLSYTITPSVTLLCQCNLVDLPTDIDFMRRYAVYNCIGSFADGVLCNIVDRNYLKSIQKDNAQ